MNLSFGYENEIRSAVLSYNKMGERIRKVGLIDGQYHYPDYYETPPNLLDFVWIEKFNSGLTLKLKAGNLMDDETVWTQDGKVTRSFKEGRTYDFSASYRF